MATPDISSEDDLYDQGLIFPVSPLDTNYDRDDYATLKIIVGPKRENFYFPKKALCRSSLFFNAACKRHWASAATNTVTLDGDEHDPSTFSNFLTWVELGDLERAPELKISPSNRDITHWQAYFRRLLECYILGDFLQAEEFQNHIMDILVPKFKLCTESLRFNDHLMRRDIEYITSNTIPGSRGIREVVLDNTYRMICRDYSLRPQIPEMFYREIAEYTIELNHEHTAIDEPWGMDCCFYHVHRSQRYEYLCTHRQLEIAAEENV